MTDPEHPSELDRATFKHAPLANDRPQIRLLKVLSCGPPGDRSQMLRAELSTHDLADLPKYHAISYTWGEIVEQEIRLNDLRFQIRENCLYALQQFNRHFYRHYVWIDSICINQNDTPEKNEQVRNMLSIYEKATLVTACIGPAADDMPLLLDFAAKTARGVLVCSKWLASAYQKDLKEISQAVWNFVGDRAYWKRLWIVQEVVASQGRFVVLCGDHLITESKMEALREWVRRVSSRRDLASIEKVQHMLSLFKPVGWKAPDMDALLFELETNRKLCVDPRDTIFAVLGLIDWHEGQVPLRPDYGLTNFQIACKAVTKLRSLAGAGYMLRGLKLGCRSAEIAELVAQRTNGVTGGDRPIDGQSKHTIFAGQLAGTHSSSLDCSILHVRADGQLTADVQPSGVVLSDFAKRKQAELWKETQSLMASIPHHPIYSSSRKSDPKDVVAWICKEAMASDVLVPISVPSDELCLVLRQRAEQSYDIIGQGVLAPGHVLHRGKYDFVRAHSLQRDAFVTVDLSLTAEDVVCLMAQDVEPSGERNVRARAERLTRNVACDASSGAATAKILHRNGLI